MYIFLLFLFYSKNENETTIMKKDLFTIILYFVLFSIFSFLSCVSDDGENVLNNIILINGKKCEIHDASCSFHGTISDDLGEFEIPPHGGFTMQFKFDESLYYFEFSVDGASSSDFIEVGENLVVDGMVDVGDFRQITSIELSTRYYDEDGKLSISEKGSNYVVVNFDNFSFIKDTGKSEAKYTINGKVKFIDINK